MTTQLQKTLAQFKGNEHNTYKNFVVRFSELTEMHKRTSKTILPLGLYVAKARNFCFQLQMVV